MFFLRIHNLWMQEQQDTHHKQEKGELIRLF